MVSRERGDGASDRGAVARPLDLRIRDLPITRASIIAASAGQRESLSRTRHIACLASRKSRAVWTFDEAFTTEDNRHLERQFDEAILWIGSKAKLL